MRANATRQALAEMRHSQRATAALQALTEQDPALAALALWCQHRDDDRTALAETWGSEIRYGAGFAALPLHEQTGVAGHHILHVALQHPGRMQAMADRMGPDFAPDIWQIGCDALINEALLAAGHALPRPALTLSRLMESIGAKSDTALLAEWDAERLYHRLVQTGASGGRGESTRKDSAALTRAYAQDQGFQPDFTAADTAAEDSAAPDQVDAGDWRAHLARALAAGRMAGVGLGALGLRLADLPQPHTPWELVLRRLLLRATLQRPAPSTARPSRRWLAQAGLAVGSGAALPAWQPRLQAPQASPAIAVALDCSGSIPTDMLRRLVAEASGIARRMTARVTLLVFDEEIRHEITLDPANWRQTLATLELPEGGGTDFRPVLARASALGASVLVVLSDLDGPTGGKRPACPVIWASPDLQPRAMPFGHVLSLAR
ncbi:putative metal-dependent peptidase [Roseinatronobacter thiooxidans]|uniref:Putative metal-dependent peptidase n=2 Tax=Roseinatronobacter thiooxidans TaxID=121821 RepID=A0A2W7Q0Z1_9RHOB|nr:putative metal-dependent peptidase [Roseinatronobacter thiooxidans]